MNIYKLIDEIYEVFDSASTQEIKTTSQHITSKELKGMNIYKLIDWNYVLIPMNRKKESDRTKASLLELCTILKQTNNNTFL